MRLGHERMVVGEQRDDLEAEQRVVVDGFVGVLLGDDRHLGAVLHHQRDRVGVEARDDVQLDLGPALAEGIHGRHQPVEAGVALDHDAQLPAAAQRQTRHVALGFLHQRQRGIGQLQQPQSRGAELRRHRLALEELRAVAVFEQLDLVRQRRLREVQQLRRAHQAAGVAQRNERAQVAYLQDRLKHE